MIKNRKTGALVVAGLAAFAYYKYTRMTPEEKAKFTDTLKEKAKSLYDHLIPGSLGSIFGGAVNK